MKIETYIDSLIAYAMNCGLTEPEDHIVATNRILDLLRLDDYTPADELLTEDLETILAGIHGIGNERINVGLQFHSCTSISTPPWGRMLSPWHAPSPNTPSMPTRNASRISKGTKAWTVPAKPPPWTR